MGNQGSKKMVMRVVLLMLFIAAAAIVTLLLPNADNRPVAVDDTGSTVEGVQQVVDANNQFAFDLYSELNTSEDGNIFYSPYSIASAVAMTYEGAQGETADQIQSVFHFPENDVLRPNFAAIYNDLNEKDKEYELKTGNALWAQYDYKFLEDYIERVEKFYGGQVENLDFANESEKSRETINTYIEEQTNGIIKDLIPEDVLDEFTRLVLTNAIYFKGTWAEQFDEDDTQDLDFTTISGSTVSTPMMHLFDDDARFRYAETEDAQVLELLYEGDNLSMMLILPEEGSLAAVEESISNENLSDWKESMYSQRVNIIIPKFKFETTSMLTEVLDNMGMPIAFGSDADFSGMDGSDRLLIQEIIHKAFVEVNEEGTEAAAATAVLVGIEATSEAPVIPLFKADRPFIFTIQDNSTGNILFLGRVADPTK